MYRVWAPAARQLQIDTGGAQTPLAPCEHGWWRLDRELQTGADYALRIDGGQPLPDPASRWQPAGVNGPSRWIDPQQFVWRHADFTPPDWRDAIVYELHIGTFSPQGTFDSAIERLDHLTALGVTHVELMPVAEWDGPRGWGYDGVDWYAPHHAYGGPEALARLVDACHGRGLAVLLDVVYNHLGPSGAYLPRFGPYFSDRHHTAWGAAANYDGPGSDEVREFVIQNALLWLRDYRFDGLRLDAVHAIVDISARHILEELRDRVDELEQQTGRRFVLVAESDLNDPRIIQTREHGGYALDAHWADDVHHALHAVLTGEHVGYYGDFGSFAQLADAMRSPYTYAGGYSPFRDRRHGRAPDGLAGEKFVVALQNHDQIGNRAQGDRITSLVSPDRARVGAALILMSPYIPLLFQGEEWGAATPFQYFTSFPDRNLGEAVSRGRRNEFKEFGWTFDQVPDPQDSATFERSKLRWDELDQPAHRDMLDWYQQLIRLRRAHPVLRDGERDAVQVAYDEAACWLRVERGPIAIACNLGKAPADVPTSAGQSTNVLAASGHCQVAAGAVRLAPDSVIILGPALDH